MSAARRSKEPADRAEPQPAGAGRPDRPAPSEPEAAAAEAAPSGAPSGVEAAGGADAAASPHGAGRPPEPASPAEAAEVAGGAEAGPAGAETQAASAETGPASAEAEADLTDPEALRARLQEQTERCRQLTERLQRLAADYANFQKRSQRRLQEEQAEALRRLVCDLLPVVDNFERALEAARAEGRDDPFYQGICLVHDQLMEVLGRHGVEPIEAAGRPFDPRHHEAVAHVPSHEHPSGHVIQEVQRGWRHGDRTLRASRVAVSAGPPGGEEGGPGERAEGGTSTPAPETETGETTPDAAEASQNGD